MHPLSLTPQDRDQWARSPGTELFVQELQTTILETQHRWSVGHFTGDTNEETLRLTAQALSQLDMLRQVIELVDELKIVPNLEGETEDDTSHA